MACVVGVSVMVWGIFCTFGWLCKLWVLFVGILIIRSLLFGFYIGVPVFLEIPT